MKITLRQLRRDGVPRDLIVHSLDQALYQVTAVIDGSEQLLSEDNGRVFRRHSLNAIREALQPLPVASLRLRQQSAYDEMIGQPAREQDNTLELPLSMEAYPPIDTH